MNRILKKWVALAALLLLSAGTVCGQPFLRLPSIVGDHMVLQADTVVTLHGWADPNARVTVTPSWGEPVTVRVGFDTKWEVKLRTPEASSKAHTIVFQSNRKAARTVKDVLIGQVWLCSGQSNMNWSAANGIVDMKQELTGKLNPQIRLFTVTKNSSPYPAEDCVGRWEVCDAESALYFSAVGYFFGKRLAGELRQPVGLVNSSWGGTPVEVWTPASVMKKNPQMVAAWKKHSKYGRGWDIGSLYNAMIVPLLRTTFAGAIWYQGESNKENAALYGEEFRMMIESWRKAFRQSLPFYFVQIAPHARTEGGITGALVREQQARVAATVPETGMVVIPDLVDDVTNIHPAYKKGVGDRLAGWALGEVYGKKDHKYRHAIFRSAEFKRNQVIVSFDHAEGGGVEDVLREHFLVRGEAARGDDHLAGADDELVALVVDGFDADDGAVFRDELLGARLREDFTAAGLDVVDEALDDFGGAALEEVPGHKRFVLVVHRADAAEFDAHVLDFVDRLLRFFNQHAKNGRVGTEVMELQSGVENLLHGRLDAVFLLIARVDAERPFREEAGAAQEGELFKNEGLRALVHGRVRSGEAAQTTADDDEVNLLFHDGRKRGGDDAREGRTGGGRTDQLTTSDFHKSFSFGQGSRGAHVRKSREPSFSRPCARTRLRVSSDPSARFPNGNQRSSREARISRTT